MTNRSNHIPTFTNTLMIIMIHRLVRHFLSQNNCGTTTLHTTISQ